MGKEVQKICSFIFAVCLLVTNTMPAVIYGAESPGISEVPTKESIQTEIEEEMIDFEAEEQVSEIAGFITEGMTIEASEDKNHTENGKRSLKIIPGADGKFGINKRDLGLQIGKKVSVWIYDDMSEQQAVIMCLADGENADSKANRMYFGIKGGAKYQAYSATKTAYTDFSVHKIDRTEGWHKFSIDMENPGIVKFYLDEVLFGEISLDEGEYGQFSTISFINYWNNATAPSYIDDLSIMSRVPIPTNPLVNDAEDTFDWTYDFNKTDPSDYEYTIDGGGTWSDCTKKPLFIGNINCDSQKVGVRCKAPEGVVETYPAIFNTEPFTSQINTYFPMEEEHNISYFENFGDQVPTVTLTDQFARSGLTCLKIVPGTSHHFCLGKRFESNVKEKVVTIWFYDSLVTYSRYYKGVCSVEDLDENGKSISSAIVGVDNYASKQNYSYRINWGKTEITDIKRTQGWHSYQWDFTSGKQCEIYIDGIKVTSYDAEGFDSFNFIDNWSISTFAQYYDDFSITDSRNEVPLIPAAPTSPITDDDNNTFGWTNVDGYTEPQQYEYSIDGGASFTQCTKNPQEIPSGGFPAGIVMVRLMAKDGCEAGSVLRSTEPFTEALSIALDELKRQIDFCKYSNPSDYTKETYDVLVSALSNAEKVGNESKDLTVVQAALDSILQAKENLVFAMDHEVLYPFSDEKTPVIPYYGTVDWSDKTNISYITQKAYKINSEVVDGESIARLYYTFPKPLQEKQIKFFYNDNLSTGGQFDIIIGDSKAGSGNIISSKNENGSGNRRIMFYDIVNQVRGNKRDLGMRRRNDLHEIEVNMTNGQGTQIYMDSILVFSNPNQTSIDYLDFSVIKDSDDAKPYLSIDELCFRDKNPVESITLPVKSVDLGYYDTYEINVINYKLTTTYDYDTTDKFTYSVKDPSIARITKGGSIQPMAIEGSTTATVTSSSGQTASVQVNIHDYKVQGVEISDSPASQKPNPIDSLTMTTGMIKVVNGIITPEGVTNRKKTWTSSDEKVATVKDGMITALAPGRAEIMVTTEDGGLKDSIAVVVVEKKNEFGQEFYVAQDGNDYSGDGSKEFPFATPTRARDEVRSLCQVVPGGVCIYFREGTYTFTDSLELTEQDSGDDKNEVVYMPYNNEEVHFTGAVSLAPADFKRLEDEASQKKLQESAKGKVYVADVSAYITAPLSVQALGYGNSDSYQSQLLKKDGMNVSVPYYSLSFGNELMTLSRWPNKDQVVPGCSYSGFTKTDRVNYAGAAIRDWQVDMVGNANYVQPEDRDIYDSLAFTSNQFKERMKTWNGVPIDGTNILDQDIWYDGYTGVDYCTQTSPIRSISADGVIKSHIACTYWAKSTSYTRFYVYNLLQELDIPGEWYLDKVEKKLYIYPPEGADMTSKEKKVSLSVLGDSMFSLKNAQHITIDGFHLGNTLGAVYTVTGGNHNKLSNCEITNTASRIGEVTDSTTQRAAYNGIEYCDIKNVNGGFTLEASCDYENLTPGYNFVHGCMFDNYQTMTNSFNSAIVLHGVGNVASCNEIKNSPNNAIMWQGNDHVIEFNNIHDVDLQTTDTSAIYTGRNVLNRGTIIKNNYIHNLGKTRSRNSNNIAIYLDDVSAGIRVYDNVMENVYWGVFVNGGQDHYITDNTFTNCRYAVEMNDWSYCWLSRWYQHGYGLLKDSGTLVETTVDWKNPNGAYAKYPHMQTIYEDAKNDSIYNKIIHNTYSDVSQFVYYWNRECQPNAANVIKDWLFQKGNIKE